MATTKRNTGKTTQAGRDAGCSEVFPKPLKPRIARFVAEYLRDHNAKQAYIRAGYAARGNSAEVSAIKLLRTPQVSAEIAKADAKIIQKVQEETGITLARTIREIARGAFHDPRKFFHADGRLKNIAELDDDTAAALAGFDVTEEFSGSGQERALSGFTKKIKLADRKGYLDMLMKHLGGYKEDNTQRLPAAEALREFFGALHAGAGRIQHVKSTPRQPAGPGNTLVKG